MTRIEPAGFTLALTVAFAVSAAAQEPIKIGVLGPNSGPYAIIGEEVRNGFDTYLSEIGSAAGGRKIEMIYEDTQAKPDVGLTKAKKLVEKDGVAFIGGVVSSSVAYALRDYIVAKNIPFIVTVASADGLTQKLAASNIFRTNSSGSQVSHPLGKWLYDVAGYKKLVMIAPNYAMGYEQTGGFARTFVAAGGKIVKALYPPLGAADFGPFLTSFDPTSADAVGAVFAGSDAIKFVKQYAEYGLKGKIPLISTILLTDDLILQEEGDAAIGITSASHYSSTLETAANKAFVDAYRKKYQSRSDIILRGILRRRARDRRSIKGGEGRHRQHCRSDLSHEQGDIRSAARTIPFRRIQQSGAQHLCVQGRKIRWQADQPPDRRVQGRVAVLDLVAEAIHGDA